MDYKLNIKNIINMSLGTLNKPIVLLSLALVFVINIVFYLFNKDAQVALNVWMLFMSIMFTEMGVNTSKTNVLASYLPITKLEYILSIYFSSLISIVILCFTLGCLSFVFGINQLTSIYNLIIIGVILIAIFLPIYRINYTVSYLLCFGSIFLIMNKSVEFVSIFKNISNIILDKLSTFNNFTNNSLLQINILTLFISILFLLISIFISYKIYSRKDIQ